MLVSTKHLRLRASWVACGVVLAAPVWAQPADPGGPAGPAVEVASEPASPPDPGGAPLDIAAEEPIMEIASDGPGAQQAYGEARRPLPYEDYHYVRRDVAGLRLGGGMAFTHDVDGGWYGRLEYTLLSDYSRGSGGLYLAIGAEGWAADEAAGGSMPYTANFGLEYGVLFASFGLGFDLILVDRVYEETGVGFIAPSLAGAFGLNFNGFRILADARGKYRWQFRAEDRLQGLFGLALEVPVE